jgi:hypothetical protein
VVDTVLEIDLERGDLVRRQAGCFRDRFSLRATALLGGEKMTGRSQGEQDDSSEERGLHITTSSGRTANTWWRFREPVWSGRNLPCSGT